jgi:hypothetical protein
MLLLWLLLLLLLQTEIDAALVQGMGRRLIKKLNIVSLRGNPLSIGQCTNTIASFQRMYTAVAAIAKRGIQRGCAIDTTLQSF